MPGTRGKKFNRLALGGLLVGLLSVLLYVVFGEGMSVGESAPVAPGLRPVSSAGDLPEGLASGEQRLSEAPVSPAAGGPAIASKAARSLASSPASGVLSLRVLWGDDLSPAEGVLVSVRRRSDARHAPPRTAVTDADGMSRFEGLRAGRLTAFGDRGGSVSVDVVAGETVEAVLPLPFGPWVHGVVLDPEGGAVAGARIWMNTDRDPSEGVFVTQGRVITQAAEDGRFSIRCVAVGQSLCALGESGWGPSPLTRVPGAESGRIDVELLLTSGGKALSVFVHNAQGVPLAGADAFLGGEDGWVRPSASDGSLGGSPPLRELTDERGVAQFVGAPPGITSLYVRAEGYSPVTKSVRLAEDEQVEVEVTLAAPVQVSGVVFTGRGAKATPVAGALVTGSGFVDSVFASLEVIYRETTTDARGRWSMTGDLPAGMLSFTARHPAHGSDSVQRELIAGRSYQLNLQLTHGLQIHGRVVDERGAARPGFVVRLAEGSRPLSPGVTTGPAGGFAFPNRPNRAHRVHVFEPGRKGSFPVLTVEDIWPEPDPLRLVLATDALPSGELLFSLADQDGVPVVNATPVLFGAKYRSDVPISRGIGPGSWRAGPLPPGDYSLIVLASRFHAQRILSVSVGPEQRVDLGVVEIQLGGRLLVKATLPPGLPEKNVGFLVRDTAGRGVGGTVKTTDGWLSQVLEPGSYQVHVSGVAAANDSGFVEVHSQSTTLVPLVLQRGIGHRFELLGLASSQTVAVFDERSHGERWSLLEVSEQNGRPVTQVRLDLDDLLARPHYKPVVQLVPGAYSAVFRIAEDVLAEADFIVEQTDDHRAVTRLTVFDS